MTSGSKSPGRRQLEEGVVGGVGMREHERALAQVVEAQRRENEDQPGGLDRQAAEMPHVGVERLRSRHRQEDGAQDDESR